MSKMNDVIWIHLIPIRYQIIIDDNYGNGQAGRDDDEDDYYDNEGRTNNVIRRNRSYACMGGCIHVRVCLCVRTYLSVMAEFKIQ